jgi:signal transduction histidine kinase
MIRRARVLIVDDDPALLQALSDTLQLRMRGLVVETADCGSAALERLHATDYDAIAADIKMPGMDGIELLRRIRDLQPDTPVLLITGHGEHDLAIQALRGGAHDYVQKPIDRDYFVGSLTHAIERRRLTRKVVQNKARLEKHSRDLEDCLDERTRELRELYQRETLARAELERTSAQLETARRRKDELVSVIAHELATPLTTLRGYAQILSRANLEASQRDRAKRILLSEMLRMERLLNDLVRDKDTDTADLSLSIEPCDLVAVAREQVEVASARSKRHTIVLDAPDRLNAECDPERMAQVLANLLANAVAYTSRGEVRMTLSREGQQIHVNVTDEGPGIPPEELTRIFEPHVRLDGRRGHASANGKGLGLSIAREIVEAHGGRIWAESDPGQGASFTLVLPVSSTPRSPRSAARGGSRIDKLVPETTAGHQPHSRRRAH